MHLRTVLPPGTLVPIGWVAVGDPLLIAPPERHEEIWAVQRELDFPGYIWGLPRPIPSPAERREDRCPRSPAGLVDYSPATAKTGSSTATSRQTPPEPCR